LPRQLSNQWVSKIVRAIIQRVNQAKVDIQGKTVSHIEKGFFILLGIAKGDTHDQVKTLADKCAHLRIFEDNNGKFNLSILDTGGEALVASQFTLLADTSRGRRPIA
jgi:D-tyrosyl-tRNA(Tyr) deacylase